MSRYLRLDGFIIALIATVLLATLLPARGAAAGAVAVLADAAIVLLFFLNGAKLSRKAVIAGARHWRLHLAVLAMTFVVFPLLGLLLAAAMTGALGLDASLATGVVFLSVVPSTVQSSIAFTAIAGGNIAGAVCSAALSNLLGVFLTPGLVAMTIEDVGTASGAGVAPSLSGAAATTIVLQLLVPFVIGHLLRPRIGGWVDRHRQVTMIADRGSILLIVYGAFGAAVVEGLWQRTSGAELAWLLAVCSVLLAAVLASSALAGRLLGFAREDRIVLLFCGSKKSLAAGVPIAGVLFPAATVGVIILPLMIFHQIQLFACAVLARRFAEGPPG